MQNEKYLVFNPEKKKPSVSYSLEKNIYEPIKIPTDELTPR